MMSVFKNLVSTKSKTRADALRILSAGLSSVLTSRALEREISMPRKGLLRVGQREFEFRGRLFVVGGGKAALNMASTFERVAGAANIARGAVVGVDTPPVTSGDAAIEYFKGTHPMQSPGNVVATRALLQLLEEANLTSDDCVVCLISGGCSALFCQPTCTLDELIALNRQLLRCGADIAQINAVRKHLSRITGGQLAKLAAPARVVSIIISDVIGNDISVIASGPTALDRSTLSDVRGVIDRFALHRSLGFDDADAFMRAYKFHETPKEESVFERVTNIVLVDSQVALNAMRCARGGLACTLLALICICCSSEATSLGYRVRSLGVDVRGEARDVGAQLASALEPGEVSVLSTSVHARLLLNLS
jgi:glycerate 2-kinase